MESFPRSQRLGPAASFNVNRYFALAADTGGHYSDQLNTHTVMFGPQLKFHSDMFTPFAEYLIWVGAS